MKVREWLDDLYRKLCEAGTACCPSPLTDPTVKATFRTVVMAAEIDGLLDAEVIGLPCPTCGGSGSVSGAQDFPGGDEGYDVTCAPCPDCLDTTRVIAPEAWVNVKDEVLYQLELATSMDDIDDAHLDGALGAILQVLLPSARVATELRSAFRFKGDPGEANEYDTGWYRFCLKGGAESCTIAILAKQEEE